MHFRNGYWAGLNVCWFAALLNPILWRLPHVNQFQSVMLQLTMCHISSHVCCIVCLKHMVQMCVLQMIWSVCDHLSAVCVFLFFVLFCLLSRAG